MMDMIEMMDMMDMNWIKSLLIASIEPFDLVFFYFWIVPPQWVDGIEFQIL